MITFRVLVVAGLLLGGTPAIAQVASPAQTWIATWAAPAAARLDQPAQTLPATAQAFPWSKDVPAAVREATPNQELPIGGASPLHFKDQTLRQIAHISVGGARVRVVLANSLGTLPLNIGAASVALRDNGAAIKPASKRALTFGGLAGPTIPGGAILVSDPVDLDVPDGADLVVDLYLPDDTAAWKSPLTVHQRHSQVEWPGGISPPGSHATGRESLIRALLRYARWLAIRSNKSCPLPTLSLRS